MAYTVDTIEGDGRGVMSCVNRGYWLQHHDPILSHHIESVSLKANQMKSNDVFLRSTHLQFIYTSPETGR